MTKHVIYYTAWHKPEKMTRYCLGRLANQCTKLGMRLHVVSEENRHKDLTKGAQFHKRKDPGLPRVGYVSILRAAADIAPNCMVYVCEDDVLYHDIHFVTKAPENRNRLSYNLNLIYLTPNGYSQCGFGRGSLAMSQIVGTAAEMAWFCNAKLDEIDCEEFCCYEPALGGARPYVCSTFRTAHANIDLRLGNNATWSAGKCQTFQDEIGWPNANELLEKLT